MPRWPTLLPLLLAPVSAGFAANLTPAETTITAEVDNRRDAAVELLAETVNIQSATENRVFQGELFRR
jgi:hypothetical protein